MTRFTRDHATHLAVAQATRKDAHAHQQLADGAKDRWVTGGNVSFDVPIVQPYQRILGPRVQHEPTRQLGEDAAPDEATTINRGERTPGASRSRNGVTARRDEQSLRPGADVRPAHAPFVTDSAAGATPRNFATLCRLSSLPEPVAEHKFHPSRRWRFDWAWPQQMVALEIEGGLWTGGRHSGGSGAVADLEKYSEAAILGWRVIYCQPSDLLTVGMDRIRRALLPFPDAA